VPTNNDRFLVMDVTWVPGLMAWGYTRVCPKCEGGGVLGKAVDISDDPFLVFLAGGEQEAMLVRNCDECDGRGRVLWACNN